MSVSAHELRKAWVARVFGVTLPGGQASEELERTKAQAAIVERDFRNFAGALARLPGGDVHSPNMAGLRKELDSLKPGDEEQAKKILEDMRESRNLADAALEAENERRRKVVVPLDETYSGGKVNARLAELAQGLRLLEDGDARTGRLQEAAKTLQTARTDKGLSMMNSTASDFDAAAEVAGKAVQGWEEQGRQAAEAIAAEQKARREKLAALAKDMSSARQELETAIASPVLNPKSGDAKVGENRKASLGKAVPAWTRRDALLKTLAGGDDDQVAQSASGAYRQAIADREKACKDAADLAEAVNGWTKSFGEIATLGQAASLKQAQFQKQYTDMEAALKATGRRMAAAVGAGDFKTARSEIEAMAKVMEVTEAAMAKAAKFDDAASHLQAQREIIAGHLQEGRLADAVNAGETLRDTVDAAGTAATDLPPAIKSWATLSKKRLSDLDTLCVNIGKLVPDEKRRSAGALLQSEKDLANARTFVKAVDAYPGLYSRTDACLDANYPFVNIKSPQAGVFRSDLGKIISGIDLAADPTFGAAKRAIDVLAEQITDAWKLRDKNRGERDALETRITREFGKDTAAGKTFLEMMRQVSLDTGQQAKDEFARINGAADALSQKNNELNAVIKTGEADIGGASFAMMEIVARKQAAQVAVAALINRSDVDPTPQITALKDAYDFVARFDKAQRKAESNVKDAQGALTPDELVQALTKTWQAAMAAAQKIAVPEADDRLDAATRLAAAIKASTQMFETVDALIEHGTPNQKQTLPALRTQAISVGLTWRGKGPDYAGQVQGIVGDLKAAAATGYQPQRDARDPDAVIKKFKDIVPVYASLEDPPDPPDNPEALIKQIDAEAAGDNVASAFKRLEREFDPLAQAIEDIHPKLTEIGNFQADWAAVSAAFNNALADAHPKHEKELNDSKQAAFDLRLTDPVKARALLAPLPARVNALDTKKTGWKATVVPKPAAGRATDQTDRHQLLTDAKNLLADGGLSVGAIGQLVSASANRAWAGTTNYPDGFDYEWTASDGTTIRIYGHGPSVGNHISPDAVSGKGNIVRIVIGNQYLRADGSTGALSNTDSGHIPLFGGP
ncbi:MAG TPA: polymorphic toxin type 30 domain-containing protein [Rhodopila sp.]|uniref:polymorphic toxin type 30 domain-containing protein n=1 Tax=Rhodopila sp. TaxID=2480087 RepID=UPI002BBFDE69|nr:polymorphic toxin type 30 domain-containing protein [Rhodopila sp.]HVY15037.1 polymorphic toxin type 30 domain-containing protein [Rhodopila sp.]